MTHLLVGTRYLILIPIIGLALAATFLFVFGGVSLVRMLYESLPGLLGFAHAGQETSEITTIFKIGDYVHTLLVGTVLYITAVGLYQLFIKEHKFAGWLNKKLACTARTTHRMSMVDFTSDIHIWAFSYLRCEY